MGLARTLSTPCVCLLKVGTVSPTPTLGLDPVVVFLSGPESDFGWTVEGSWKGRMMPVAPGDPWGLVLEMLMAVALPEVSGNLQTSVNHFQRPGRCSCSMMSGFKVGPG